MSTIHFIKMADNLIKENKTTVKKERRYGTQE